MAAADSPPRDARSRSPPRRHSGGPPPLALLFGDLRFTAQGGVHARTLGRGAFSKVKLAVSKLTGEPVAVKVIDKVQMSAKAAKSREHRARMKARERHNKDAEQAQAPAADEHSPAMPQPCLPDLVRKLLPEPQLLLLLSHPNIVRLLAVAESPSWCLCAMEYLPHGCLSTVVPPRGLWLEEAKARNYFRQLLLAIHHAHARGVVHRDLKPENVMLSDWEEGAVGTGVSDPPVAPRTPREPGQDSEGCFRLVVADFGLGRGRWKGWGSCPASPERTEAEAVHDDHLDLDMETFCGTPNFAAPELVSGQPYDATLSDAWALGVLLYLLLHPKGSLPFSSPNSLAHLYTLIRACSPDYSAIPDGPADLLRAVFVRDPDRRLNVECIMRDPWVNQGGWKAGELALLHAREATERPAAKQLVSVHNGGRDGEFVVCTVGRIGYRAEDRASESEGESSPEGDSGFLHGASRAGSQGSNLHLPISRRASELSAAEISATLAHDVLGVGGVVGLEPRGRRRSALDETHAVLDPGEGGPVPRRMSWTQGSGALPTIGESSSSGAGSRRSSAPAVRPADAHFLRRPTLSQVEELPSPQAAQEPPKEADPITLFHTLHRPALRIRRLSFTQPGLSKDAQHEVRTVMSAAVHESAPNVFQLIHAAIVGGGNWACTRQNPEIYCFSVVKEYAAKDGKANEAEPSRMDVEIFEYLGGVLSTILTTLSISPAGTRKPLVVRCRTWLRVDKAAESKNEWACLEQRIVDTVQRGSLQ